MAAQKRWLCTGCAREFAHIVGWEAGDPCPVCGASLEQMTYLPDMPGGDIPRGQPSLVVTPVVEEAASIPDSIRGLYTSDNLLLVTLQGGH